MGNRSVEVSIYSLESKLLTIAALLTSTLMTGSVLLIILAHRRTFLKDERSTGTILISPLEYGYIVLIRCIHSRPFFTFRISITTVASCPYNSFAVS